MNALIKNIDANIYESKNGEFLLVRLVASNGAIGYGEATLPGSNPQVKSLIKNIIAPFLTGKDICQANALSYELMTDYSNIALRRAIAGVEIASWDAFGKTVGQPVYKLLGGKALPVLPLSAGLADNPYAGAASITRLKLSSLSAADLDGITRIKSKGGNIIIDCSDAPAGADMAEYARAAGSFDPVYITGLSPIEDEPAWDALKAAGKSPMAARASARADAYPYIIKARASVIEADALNAPGILELRKLAALAHTYYVNIAGYTEGGEIAAAAACHSLLSCANAVSANLPEAGYPELLSGRPDYTDFDKPGLGIELVAWE